MHKDAYSTNAFYVRYFCSEDFIQPIYCGSWTPWTAVRRRCVSVTCFRSKAVQYRVSYSVPDPISTQKKCTVLEYYY